MTEQTHIRIILTQNLRIGDVTLKSGTPLLRVPVPEGLTAQQIATAINTCQVRAQGCNSGGAKPGGSAVLSVSVDEETGVVTLTEPVNRMKKPELQGLAKLLGLDQEGTMAEITERIEEAEAAYADDIGEELIVVVDSIS